MLIAVIMLVLLFHKYLKDYIYATIVAVCALTTYVFFSVEFMSVIHHLGMTACRVFMVAFDVVIFGICYMRLKKEDILVGDLEYRGIYAWFPLLFMAMLVLAISLNTIPYNYDSLTYHLPRIMHWIQNKSVAHYATNCIRQISSPVLAGFVSTFAYLLWGRQEFVFNFLQFGSYLINTCLVVAIARKLGCPQIWSFFSGFLFMSMPIAFAEALSTQNDLFATVWLLMFVYVLLDYYSDEKISVAKENLLRVIILGECVAFGYLAKPSVGFAMIYFLAGLLVCSIKRKDDILTLLKLGMTAAVTMLVIVLPELTRNYRSFHAFSDPFVGERQLVGTVDVRYLFINFLKNFSFNLASRYIRFDEVCDKVIRTCASWLNVILDDPTISEDGRGFRIPTGSLSHNSALNPIILTAAILAFIMMLSTLRDCRWKKNQKIYGIISVMSYLSICVFMRWEPYVSRYLLSYLALLCPMVAVVCAHFFRGGQKWCVVGITGILVITSVIEIKYMVSFHWGHTKQSQQNVRAYFDTNEELYLSCQETASYVNNHQFKTIGLALYEDDPEYPIWKMLDDYERIEHVFVENSSKKYLLSNYQPECIMIYHRSDITQEDLKDAGYAMGFSNKEFMVWILE